MTEDELTLWEEILETSYKNFSHKKSDAQDIINNILNNFNFVPTEVWIATARAVFNSDYQWIKIISIIDKCELHQYIESYELEAIKLGLHMRKELDDENLVIINDNKHAVADITGNPFYMFDFHGDNDIENKLKVVWARRNNVKLADKLKVKDATKIFIPDYDFDDFDF